MRSMAQKRVAYITAVFGNFEATCKAHAEQTVPSDFICFTDSERIKNDGHDGWIVDTLPYHTLNPSPLDDGVSVNSLANNQHPFNIAKYYKQAFHNIPRLQGYEAVVWLDGTVEITEANTSQQVLQRLRAHGSAAPVVFEHEDRRGVMKDEMLISHIVDGGRKYLSTVWNGFKQPSQDLRGQYQSYVEDGYTDDFWRRIEPHRPNRGMWITCFVGWDMANTPSASRPEVASVRARDILDLWYLQTLTHTTQDQMGFPYALQKLGVVPGALPDEHVSGMPHKKTDWYIKHDHGR